MRRVAFAFGVVALLAAPSMAYADDQGENREKGEKSEIGEKKNELGDALRAYFTALEDRKQGVGEFRLEDIRARTREAEEFLASGRFDEAVAKTAGLVEHPRFELFAASDEGRAIVYRLADALMRSGAHDLSRGYVARLVRGEKEWSHPDVYSRRAIRLTADMALEDQDWTAAERVFEAVPPNAEEQIRGEVFYVRGRARELANDSRGAMAAYRQVTNRSRVWAQSVYLQGLIEVEQKRFAEAEALFCQVADPKKQWVKTAALSDERFYRVRDLARLALGRIAHEQTRFDDARYYYYLVPRDSDRLAEALYESATSRYEKKDYESARELLDELNALKVHHPYEDEAQILDAYVELARCQFDAADTKLKAFLARFEPVRDLVRRYRNDDLALRSFTDRSSNGKPASRRDNLGEQAEVLAALVRVDATYQALRVRRANLELQARGLLHTASALRDVRAAAGGLPGPGEGALRDSAEKAARVRDAIESTRKMLDELRTAGAPREQTQAFYDQLVALEARANATAANAAPASGEAKDKQLGSLLALDQQRLNALVSRADAMKKELADTELEFAKQTLTRVDLRLSRLLRRARLGRIESVMGRKRALELEIEAIREGYLPRDALDSLNAPRYLRDNEEYWPYEGDDWPDEFVGSEAPK